MVALATINILFYGIIRAPLYICICIYALSKSALIIEVY